MIAPEKNWSNNFYKKPRGNLWKTKHDWIFCVI